MLARGTITLVRMFRADTKRYRCHATLSRVRLTLYRYKSSPAIDCRPQFLQIFSSQPPLLLTAVIHGAKPTGPLALA